MLPPKQPQTVGSSAQFDPEAFLSSWNPDDALPQNDDLRTSISKAFQLPASDKYVYRAVAAVTLEQVQQVIGFGGQHGLHGWYVDDEGKQVRTVLIQERYIQSDEARKNPPKEAPTLKPWPATRYLLPPPQT